jgi:ribonuclease D
MAGRLLGFPRVALGVLVAEILGFELAKQHSAADWSRRPLPSAWLRYAALDVELLLPLRDRLEQMLTDAGKLEWAQQEFAHTLEFSPAARRPDPWRRTPGTGLLRNTKQLAVVRGLWEARETVSQARDIAPNRVLPDRAIMAAAQALPRSIGQLVALREFSDPRSRRRAATWQKAIDSALALPVTARPSVRGPSVEGPPKPRSWPVRRPDAAVRLENAREALAQVEQQVDVPVENLLLPDSLRRLAWEPPAQITPETVAGALVDLKARPWQIELIAAPLAAAFAVS